MDFLAINLDDFSKRQLGVFAVTTQIRMLSSETIADAMDSLKRRYPETSWFVIPKNYCNRHIVHKSKEKSCKETENE
jgi:uncharacterized protein with HEPN domain